MTTDIKSIKVVNGALEEGADGSIVLRGTLSMETLRNLKVDTYQREVLAKTGAGSIKATQLKKSVEQGAHLPDVVLGMRGQGFTSSGNTFVLKDPTYIVDGLQRVSAILSCLDNQNSDPISTSQRIAPIGAMIHFKTTEDWENDRFNALNAFRTAVSPNILLRNIRAKHPSLKALYQLCTEDANFPLYKRVTWTQRKGADELISAATLMRAAVFIHRHVIDETASVQRANKAGGAGEKASRIPAVLDRVVSAIGATQFKKNITYFFSLIDSFWGIRTIKYGEAQGHLKGNFLAVLGGFISRNEVLWDSRRRAIDIDKRTLLRIKSFPVQDAEIRRLSAAGTMVLPTLNEYLMNHMNKGLQKKNFFK